MENTKTRIGVLISGNGTNLQEILTACTDGKITGEVAVVISNKEEAYGLERAKKENIPAIFIDPKNFTDEADFNNAIKEKLEEYKVSLVVMAGYMRLLGPEVLNAFPDAVLNIHPALLPSFPGAHGIKDAFDYGVKITGVTVHFANEKFDAGGIILQEVVVVEEDDTLETLEAKIHLVEYKLYPEAINLFINKRLKPVNGKVKILTL